MKKSVVDVDTALRPGTNPNSVIAPTNSLLGRLWILLCHLNPSRYAFYRQLSSQLRPLSTAAITKGLSQCLHPLPSPNTGTVTHTVLLLAITKKVLARNVPLAPSAIIHMLLSSLRLILWLSLTPNLHHTILFLAKALMLHIGVIINLHL
jgi:hypothetical protein